jgi:hypothetical protein
MRLKKIYCLVCLLLFTSVVFSQNYMNRKKSKCLKWLTAIKPQKGSITQTDSTIFYEINDGKSDYFSLTLFFQHKRCVQETYLFGCDSCLQKSFKNAIAKKYYHWKEIKSNFYTTSKFWGMELTLLKVGNYFSYVVQKKYLTKKDNLELSDK